MSYKSVNCKIGTFTININWNFISFGFEFWVDKFIRILVGPFALIWAFPQPKVDKNEPGLLIAVTREDILQAFGWAYTQPGQEHKVLDSEIGILVSNRLLNIHVDGPESTRGMRKT